MAGLFGGGSKSQPATRYQFLNVQTSTQGLCIPAGWGQYRAAPNLLDYVDFSSKAVKQKTGKGGGGSTTSYTYSVAVMMGLVEGPVQGIGQVWQDNTVTTLAATGFTLFNGTETQAPWSYMTSKHPTRALAYAGTAYVANGSCQLGSSPDLQNYNYEVIDKLAGSMPGTVDANFGDIIPDYLTNPQYSYGFPSDSIDAASLAVFKTYQQAQGLFFSPYLNNQEQSTQTFQRWAQLGNSWIFWSGNVLKFVPLGDREITGTTLPIVQLDDGAIHQYILNDISGTVAVDTGSTPANGTYYGVYGLGQAGIASSVPNSAQLGQNSPQEDGYVALPYAEFAHGAGGAFTVEWMQNFLNDASGSGQTYIHFGNGDPVSSHAGFALLEDNSGSAVSFVVGTTGGHTAATYSPTTVANSHIVCVYDGAKIYLYVNGALQAQATCGGAYVASSNNIQIGNAPGAPAIGAIVQQCVAFYDYALTPDQVLSHYGAAVHGGGTYTPNLTPVYNLTYDDFIFKKGTDPVVVTRSDPSDGYNNVTINCNDRSNAYNATTVLWQDQSSVDQYGQLMSQTVSANEIQDTAVAQICAALIGKRAVYIRNTYAFTLGYNYVLLEPGDIVTITDPNIGLAAFPVRITNVKESKDYTLAITAEECPFGIGTPAIYNVQQSGGNSPPNVQVDPGNVNAPAIFEPSAAITGGAAEIWIGLSGGVNWGGAEVYISFDSENYNFIGDVTEGSIQGVLAAALSNHADPDIVDTLEVDLTESLSTLPATATNADADAFRTLVLVDNEVMAYGSATPTAGVNPYAFSMTYLRRGVYGTSPAAHASGAPFCRIDINTIFTYALPEEYVGATLYLKFVSFNTFGNGYQDIADVTEYTYVPTGTAYVIAPPGTPTATPSTVTQVDGTTLLTMNVAWAASGGPNLGGYNLRFSTDGGTTWQGSVTLPPSATTYQLKPALASTSYIFELQAFSQNGQALSTWSASASTGSGSLIAGVPDAPTAIAATAGAASATVTWTPSDSSSTKGNQVSYGTINVFSAATLYPVTTAGSGIVVSGLTVGTEYYFWVQAFNDAGASTPDGPANATPTAPATGSVTTSSAGELAWYSGTGTAVVGNINVTYNAGALTIGVAGTTGGSLVLSGETSGSVTVKTNAAAGSWSMTLPATAGTAGQVLSTDGSGNTSWATASGGGGGGGGISFGQLAAPTASQTLLVYPVGSGGLTLSTGLPGASAYAETAPTAAVSLTIYKNGTSIGTINWVAGANAGTFTFSADVTFASGDVLTVGAPGTPDVTFANFGIVLVPISSGSSSSGWTKLTFSTSSASISNWQRTWSYFAGTQSFSFTAPCRIRIRALIEQATTSNNYGIILSNGSAFYTFVLQNDGNCVAYLPTSSGGGAGLNNNSGYPNTEANTDASISQPCFRYIEGRLTVNGSSSNVISMNTDGVWQTGIISESGADLTSGMWTVGIICDSHSQIGDVVISTVIAD